MGAAGDAVRGRAGGVFDRLRRMLATLATLAHTRLELVTVEIEEEVQRLVRIVLWALAGLFCAAVAVLLLAMTLVIAFWENRLAAALAVTVAFAVAAAAAGLVVRRRLRERPPLLSATLDELRRDARALGGGDRAP